MFFAYMVNNSKSMIGAKSDLSIQENSFLISFKNPTFLSLIKGSVELHYVHPILEVETPSKHLYPIGVASYPTGHKLESSTKTASSLACFKWSPSRLLPKVLSMLSQNSMMNRVAENPFSKASLSINFIKLIR